MFIACCASAFSARECSTSAFIVRESWTNACECCTSTFNACECMQVLSKDMVIALQLLTFAVLKDNNAFFDWWMLQVSTYTPNYRVRPRKNSDCWLAMLCTCFPVNLSYITEMCRVQLYIHSYNLHDFIRILHN